MTIFINLNFNDYKKKKIYGKKLFYTLGIGIIFLILSIIKAKEVGYTLNLRTIVQIGLIVMPAMYVFCFINIFSVKDIIKFMKFTLVVLIIIYFCEKPHNLSNFFNISNWTKISFMNSLSFTESSLCAEVFLQLFLFFYYFSNIKNNDINNKSLKICLYISLIFTVLSFKRLGIVFAFSVIILGKIVDFRGEISSKFVWLFALFFTVMTIFYTKFMQGQIFTNVDIYKFSTGRDYILSLWEKQDYFSYGYGTSMLIINRYLEMDLVQIYIELNTLAVFVFSYGFFRISYKNIYAIMIMLYTFMNMLTASSLPWSLGWIILLITISIISSDKCEDEEINIGIRKQRFKRLFLKKDKKIEKVV